MLRTQTVCHKLSACQQEKFPEKPDSGADNKASRSGSSCTGSLFRRERLSSSHIRTYCRGAFHDPPCLRADSSGSRDVDIPAAEPFRPAVSHGSVPGQERYPADIHGAEDNEGQKNSAAQAYRTVLSGSADRYRIALCTDKDIGSMGALHIHKNERGRV